MAVEPFDLVELRSVSSFDLVVVDTCRMVVVAPSFPDRAVALAASCLAVVFASCSYLVVVERTFVGLVGCTSYSAASLCLVASLLLVD